MGQVIENSESKVWSDAVEEWEIVDCEEDETGESSCICGKEGLRYLFTIENMYNGNVLFPIGSSCIKKFERDDMREQTTVYEQMYRLYHFVKKDDDYLTLTPKLFTRRLLKELYEQGAFEPNAYNHYDGERDYLFLLRMFNKKDKSSISYNQGRKIYAILYGSIIPFLKRKFENK